MPYLPLFIAIEPTNYCNYRCVMCVQSSSNRDKIPRGLMSEETFDRVLNEVRAFAMEVFIQLGGEPLLHPCLGEFIKKAKCAGLTVGISTNASLLTEEVGRNLISAGLNKLVITFTDKNRDKYEEIWQGGDYRKVEENIKRMLSLKRKKGIPRITLQIIKFFGEDRDLALDKNFLNMWRKLGVDSFSPIWATYWAGDFKDEAKYRYREAPRDRYYIPCGAIWRSIAIHWDGSVSPCCNDLSRDYILGNIREASIREMWNGIKMVRLRKDISEGQFRDIKLCRNCLSLWGRLPQEKKRWYSILENRIRRV